MVVAVTAREDYAKLDRNTSGPKHQGQTSQQAQAALDEIDALRAQCEQYETILSADLTYSDLEMKIRDGTISIRTMSTPESTFSACQRWMSAMCLHILLGDDETMPPNSIGWEIQHDSFELQSQAAGGFDKIRVFAEVVRPGGMTTREIRTELEAKIATALKERPDDKALASILHHTPAPPRATDA